ncbi:MAG TPA: NucA/NucB deoxyribonuclease domain-containing protein, partial [Gaiellaceae bacterium]|nr:NucA/NucB deoxyribonuclease domain-containing protein [Gaiellaceae bacterium]
YNSALTAQAANAAIEIHTVGLGAGVNAALLQSIATGTGATYRQLDDPNELPDLYRELAGDIIGDDTDTDEDGLTDCVERNGLFVPLRITLPFIDGSLDFASFITTDPEDADTDGDGLVDGAEVEARSLRDDPALAAEYAFLIEAGLETYYKLIANPNDPDTDGDGLNDLLELLNGTNPLSPDDSELGIDGLDLPPFTLFQPDEYEARPAIPRVLTARQEGDTILVESVVYNDTPVRYDDDRDCVEVCAAIEELARERPDDSGFGICVGPISINCADDESQERDIVEEARVAQGIFDGDGRLSETFIREQVAIQCALWFADTRACIEEAGRADVPDDVSADDFAAVLGAVTTTLPVPQGINPELARRIAEALKATATAVGVAVGTAVIADAVAECLAGPALRIVGELLPFVHPCELLPMYAPGIDTGEAVGHRFDALVADPSRVRERWASQPERLARPFPRNWYIGQPGCTAADRAAAEARWGLDVQCDEFPNWSMEKAGPGASLRYMPRADNGREGINLNAFLRACPETTQLDRNRRVPFLVVPVPVLPTIFHCGRRR